MDTLNPFRHNASGDALVNQSVCPFNDTWLNAGEYWLLDAPGITGLGRNGLSKLKAHVDAGGRLIHRVAKDGTLVEPQYLWPQKNAGHIEEQNQ